MLSLDLRYLADMIRGILQEFIVIISADHQQAFFFNKQNKYEPNSNSKFSFESAKNPPIRKNLSNFENNLYNLAWSVRFKRVSNPFQDKLVQDLPTIHASSDLFISADKTTNFNKVSIDDYNKLLQDIISAKYSKSNDKTNESAAKSASYIKLH